MTDQAHSDDSDDFEERATSFALFEGDDGGLTVQQRKVTIDEVREGVASGEIVEMFACGTAAVVVPIAAFKAEGYTIGSEDAPAGELTLSLREELTGIQYGKVADRHGWMTRLDA